jgi:hypothetical protein
MKHIKLQTLIKYLIALLYVINVLGLLLMSVSTAILDIFFPEILVWKVVQAWIGLILILELVLRIANHHSMATQTRCTVPTLVLPIFT